MVRFIERGIDHEIMWLEFDGTIVCAVIKAFVIRIARASEIE